MSKGSKRPIDPFEGLTVGPRFVAASVPGRKSIQRRILDRALAAMEVEIVEHDLRDRIMEAIRDELERCGHKKRINQNSHLRKRNAELVERLRAEGLHVPPENPPFEDLTEDD